LNDAAISQLGSVGGQQDVLEHVNPLEYEFSFLRQKIICLKT
jgi:hypothetical protein